MKIIVLGAGQVGSTVANSLARENNDVTVIDTDVDVLNELHNTLDLRTIQGSGSHPHILKQAGCGRRRYDRCRNQCRRSQYGGLSDRLLNVSYTHKNCPGSALRAIWLRVRSSLRMIIYRLMC